MSLANILKENSTAITSLFTIIATIGSAILYVEHNYANAKELQKVIEYQEKQFRLQSSQQKQLAVFQLEYYDDKIRKLQEEKRISEEREKTKTQTRAIHKSVDEIQDEIDDLKRRRDMVRKSITD